MADTTKTEGFPEEPPPNPHSAKKVDKPVSGTDTVTVCCKVPSGLLLRCFKPSEETESTPTGVRTYTIVRGVPGSEFRVNGPARSFFMAPDTFDRAVMSYPGGYALTSGMPRELWENWFHYNKDTPLVREGLIFALPSETDAALEARSNQSVESGLEAIDPADPMKRMGRRIHRDVGPVQPGSGENL